MTRRRSCAFGTGGVEGVHRPTRDPVQRHPGCTKGRRRSGSSPLAWCASPGAGWAHWTGSPDGGGDARRTSYGPTVATESGWPRWANSATSGADHPASCPSQLVCPVDGEVVLPQLAQHRPQPCIAACPRRRCSGHSFGSPSANAPTTGTAPAHVRGRTTHHCVLSPPESVSPNSGKRRDSAQEHPPRALAFLMVAPPDATGLGGLPACPADIHPLLYQHVGKVFVKTVQRRGPLCCGGSCVGCRSIKGGRGQRRHPVRPECGRRQPGPSAGSRPPKDGIGPSRRSAAAGLRSS
ncbi:hypothetical protein SAMN05421678_1175 [Actinopolymorpha cephalotaxi]|uniref:Uncharacterized protein n=1 Tax=Actinopolymorpha cephalotaxi TaxID=504797 RepID=A0A1I2ZQR1_9ACTN|nr:hypothetical protein SAMN05421678_1175 [Actinopolymorpha cephalotaxi]